jgi:two-component system OmpR family sensor kinase
MVVSIAVLAGIALVIANLAGILLLRSYLTGRVDQQLVVSALAYSRPKDAAKPLDLPAPRPRFLGDLGPDFRVYMYNKAGELTGSSRDTGIDGAPVLGSFDSLLAHASAPPYTVDGQRGHNPWRVAVAQRAGASGGLVVVAVSLHQIDATQTRLLTIDAIVTALVLLLLGLAAASVVRLGLAPLTEMETIAEEIAAGDLSRRVTDVDTHTEAGRLGMALNGMLGQIESALAARTASEQRLRQFLADASHELRTPLTSIQGFAELYRRGGTPPGPALDEAMGRIEAEAARMAVLVADLMLLARLDQERPLDREPVDLLAITADAVRDAHARAPARHIQLDGFPDGFPGGFLDGFPGDSPDGFPGDIPDGFPDGFDAEEQPAIVPGDEARLRQVATNLLANALQHTPPDAGITVRVRHARAGPPGPVSAAVGTPPPVGAPVAVLEVGDAGPGMSREQAAHVFERLYRTDTSRQRASGGAGLGLAIVAAIVTAHGGRVELRTAPGHGAAFRVLLPALAIDRTNEPIAH